jgi:hypothetical protein
MPYVYSTATGASTYIEYAPDNDKNKGHAVIVRKVTIKGGHGVATKNLITPKGVMTKVTDEELEFLLKDANFQRHMKAGFMNYDKSKVDPEKKATNMAKGDNSAPLTPDDFKEGEHSSAESRIYTGKPKK